MKRRLLIFVLAFVLLGGIHPVSVGASGLDSLNRNNGNQSQDSSGGVGDEGFDSVNDYMRGYNPINGKDMAKADKMISPITSILGVLTGAALGLADAFIFFITAIDFLYIGVPFLRRWFGPEVSGQAAGGGSPMGGMGMGGMGMGGMGMGAGRFGMMGGGGGGAAGAVPGKRQWVSDEAIQALMEAQSQAGGAGASPMGGMGGMGMGMGMGMGGMGGMGAQQQVQPSTKQAMTIYLKKRIFFIIAFGAATVLLMSSVFMDCGLNLGKLGYKIMEMLNDGLSSVTF